MKKLSLLFAVALAAPAFAQTATPATDASTTTTTTATSTSTYPPCSAQVTDQCTQTRWTHGHGRGHHYKGHRHHKK
ncbi:MAG: hypothetical protein ABIO86_10945 [Sphingomonas sp.]